MKQFKWSRTPGGLAWVALLALVAGALWGATSGSAQSSAPADRLALTVTLAKTVDPTLLEPGDARWVIYEVIFTNAASEPVVLDLIKDTLPPGFGFGGMAIQSQVGEPVSIAEPEIIWENWTIPAHGTLLMRYRARAVGRATDRRFVVTTCRETMGARPHGCSPLAGCCRGVRCAFAWVAIRRSSTAPASCHDAPDPRACQPGGRTG